MSGTFYHITCECSFIYEKVGRQMKKVETLWYCVFSRLTAIDGSFVPAFHERSTNIVPLSLLSSHFFEKRFNALDTLTLLDGPPSYSPAPQ